MSLEFTLVRRAISLAVIDGPDADDNPDILQAQGSVLFEPVIKKGDSIQVQTRGGSETYALAPIECPINDGIISHRGQDGVKLPAGGEAANPSLIRWKATFSRMQAGGKSFTLAPVVFDAVPGGEIDLTMVAPVAGAPEGVVRGPRGTSLKSIIVDGSELVFTAVDDAGSFEIARIPLDEMVRAEAEAAADGVRDVLAVDVAASQAARDAAEGHANRAATSESNAAASESAAKQSETNAGDYAAVATTAATEAVDAMERATDLAGGDFATREDAKSLVYKGVLSDGSDLNEIREPGIYSVSTVSSARTMVNYPTARAGIVMVWTNDGASVTTQEVTAYVSTTSPVEKYSRATLSSANTAWSQWASSEWSKEIINGTSDARTDIDTFRNPGAWAVSSRSYVDGLPGTGTGALEVFTWRGTGLSIQRYSERTTSGDVIWHRSSLTSTGFAGIEWQKISTSGNQEGDPGNIPEVTSHQSPEATHAARVEYARSRRGGGIGTGGKPVIMLRFDHWLAAFRDKVLPILRKYQLPATLNMNFDNIGIEANGGGSIVWGDVQDWNQRYGIEIANHGSTHTNASTAETIYHEIVEGRRNLEAAMPRVAVETWHEHGSAYLIASDIDGDIGLNLGREPKNFFESYAGRLVLAEHAVIEGKSGGFFHPLSGSPQIGQSHYSADRSTSAQAIAQVDTAQALGRGLTLYTHPGSMNNAVIGGKYWPYEEQEDGSFIVTNPTDGTTQTFADWDAMKTWAVNGGNWLNMSFAHFDELCAHLATERDAGRLMVMTAAGGAFADKSHDRRENLLVKADFTDGYSTWWSGMTGWTVTNPGEKVELTSTSSAGQINQGMLLHSRFGWAMGAAHELVVRVSANTETTLTLRAEQMGNSENWNVGETFTVPGDGVERNYRINITLPRDPSISQVRWYIGGPSMTIHGEPILAAI